MATSPGQGYDVASSPLPWRRVVHQVLCLIHMQLTCSCLILHFTLIPAFEASRQSTDIPGSEVNNLTDLMTNISYNLQAAPTNMTNISGPGNPNNSKALVEKALPQGPPRDSPMALVIAASIAAVSILVFFVLAYLWHTHQLDSRARKLAIQLAADAEHGMRSRGITLATTSRYARPGQKPTLPRAISETSQEQNHYEALTPEPEGASGSEERRASITVSESEAGDNEDVFEPDILPPLAELGRTASRGGRGAHRKLNRPRKTSSGVNLDKRDSAVTDKDILTHFAKRRHSTFFL